MLLLYQVHLDHVDILKPHLLDVPVVEAAREGRDATSVITSLLLWDLTVIVGRKVQAGPFDDGL